MRNPSKIIFTFGIIILALWGCTSNSNENSGLVENLDDNGRNEDQSSFSADPDEQPHDFELQATNQDQIPLIFSHGGAPCDIAALVYFTKHPKIDLIGMVLTDGEIRPENALDDWPVFLNDVLRYNSAAIGVGTTIPMDPNGHNFPEPWRNVADTFWGLSLPPKQTEFETFPGYELIIDLVKSSPIKVTIVGMASMVDIALALKNAPEIIDNIDQILIMGGAFTVDGNLNEGPDPTNNIVAEWNMWVDPQAAKYLFNSGVPLTIVPLDAIQYYVPIEKVTRMKSINDPGVKYVAQMWSSQIAGSPEGFFIWDTITAVAVTNPEHFYWTYDGVDVITEVGDFQGQTIALNNGETHSRYATGANYEAVLNEVFKIFEGDFQDLTSDLDSDQHLVELGGTWEGITSGDFSITFVLESVCSLDQICGTVEIPDFSYKGEVTFIEIKGKEYVFQVIEITTGQPGNPYESLTVLEDGNLRYYTTDYSVQNEGVLVKK